MQFVEESNRKKGWRQKWGLTKYPEKMKNILKVTVEIVVGGNNKMKIKRCVLLSTRKSNSRWMKEDRGKMKDEINFLAAENQEEIDEEIKF